MEEIILRIERTKPQRRLTTRHSKFGCEPTQNTLTLLILKERFLKYLSLRNFEIRKYSYEFDSYSFTFFLFYWVGCQISVFNCSIQKKKHSNHHIPHTLNCWLMLFMEDKASVVSSGQLSGLTNLQICLTSSELNNEIKECFLYQNQGFYAPRQALFSVLSRWQALQLLYSQSRTFSNFTNVKNINRGVIVSHAWKAYIEFLTVSTPVRLDNSRKQETVEN